MKRVLFALIAIGFVCLSYISSSHGFFLLFVGVTGVAIFFALFARKNVALTLLSLFAVISVFSWLGNISFPQMIKPQAVQAAAEEVIPPQPAAEAVRPKIGCVHQYPENIQPWCELIETSAQEYGLDPFLVAAVITQESVGNPNAYSSSGAVGLMQVMPRDGLAATCEGCFNAQGVNYFTERPTMAELFDPAFNIDYGSEYLAGRIAYWGSVREGVFHYGPSCDLVVHPKCDPYLYTNKVLSIYERIKN